MISVNFPFVILTFYGFCITSILTVGYFTNVTRTKRSISELRDETFKKESVSSAAFTKVGSTRLDYKTWPK